jgi:hypothetical protein
MNARRSGVQATKMWRIEDEGKNEKTPQKTRFLYLLEAFENSSAPL